MAGPGGKPADLVRLRRMLKAKADGVSHEDAAERFGLANANSFKAMCWHARRTLAGEKRVRRPGT